MSGTFIDMMGLLTIVVTVGSMQLKKVKHILLGEIVCNLLVAFNCAVQGGITGAFDCGMAAVLVVIIYRLNGGESAQKQVWKLGVSCVYAAANIGVLVMTYQKWIDVLPCLTAFMFVWKIIQNRADYIRILNVMIMLVWIYYDYQIASYSNLITHVLSLISVVIAIWRLDVQKKWTFFPK